MNKEELKEYLNKQLGSLKEDRKQTWLSEYELGYIEGQISIIADLLEVIG